MDFQLETIPIDDQDFAVALTGEVDLYTAPELKQAPRRSLPWYGSKPIACASRLRLRRRDHDRERCRGDRPLERRARRGDARLGAAGREGPCPDPRPDGTRVLGQFRSSPALQARRA